MMTMTMANATRAMTWGSWSAWVEVRDVAALTVSATSSARKVPPTMRKATGVR